MKKGAIVMLSFLMIFIGIMLGTFLERSSNNDDILISFESGYVNKIAETEPGPQIVPTQVFDQDKAKININTASVAQLMTLKNIGEVLATRIVEYRTANGPFSSIDDLLQVDGVGSSRLEEIRDEITVGG